MNYKLKKLIKTISLVLLGLSVIGGIAALTTHLVKKDKVSIHPTYEVGGLNAQGRYEEDKGSLYTKDKFACEGLEATLDFDSEINYQIFYYDILDNFVSSSEVITLGYSKDAPTNGAYARIEITPKDDEDGKISFTEKLKYSKQLNLKVDKDAEKNVSEKFKTFDGKCLEIVSSVSDLHFSVGYIEKKSNSYGFVSFSAWASTYSNILNVEGYNSLSFDITKVSGYSSSVEKKQYRVETFVFDGDTIIENYGFQTVDDFFNLSFTNFTTKPKYILLSVTFFERTDISISNESVLKSIPGAFTLNK